MRTKNQFVLRLGIGALVLATTGVVFAATQGALFSLWVDTTGKSAAQVEDEVHGKLVDEGLEPTDVEFRRDDDGNTRLDIEARTADEREIRLVHKDKRSGDGHGDGVIRMEPPRLDTEREPGMSDEELRDKILDQIAALGLDGEVEVDGEDVEVRIRKHEVVCAEGEDC